MRETAFVVSTVNATNATAIGSFPLGESLAGAAKCLIFGRDEFVALQSFQADPSIRLTCGSFQPQPPKFGGNLTEKTASDWVPVLVYPKNANRMEGGGAAGKRISSEIVARAMIAQARIRKRFFPMAGTKACINVSCDQGWYSAHRKQAQTN